MEDTEINNNNKGQINNNFCIQIKKMRSWEDANKFMQKYRVFNVKFSKSEEIMITYLCPRDEIYSQELINDGQEQIKKKTYSNVRVEE